tara:strand:+ start:2432 stop:2770 length:339 start_codon:yes stop_codon:yes gene_type:complete
MADKDTINKVYEAIEVAKATGKLKKGTNEVTKSIERGTAKLVAVAGDVEPKEITMHMPLLSEEKKILCVEVDSKEELGAAAGLPVGTAAVSITEEGEAKKIIAELSAKPKKE